MHLGAHLVADTSVNVLLFTVRATRDCEEDVVRGRRGALLRRFYTALSKGDPVSGAKYGSQHIAIPPPTLTRSSTHIIAPD